LQQHADLFCRDTLKLKRKSSPLRAKERFEKEEEAGARKQEEETNDDDIHCRK